MKIVYYLFAISGLFLSLYSCSVSIEGAPCDPEKNNCPSGQYCSEEGICKPGSPQIKDVSHIKDVNEIKDFSDIGDIEDSGIKEDVITEDIRGDGGIYDVILEDVISDSGDGGNTEDSGVDTGIDGGCIDECESDKCKDNQVILLCGDWDNNGCKEYKEVSCGSNSVCDNNKCNCVAPFKDCNGDISDGCEANTKEDPKNCNTCGNDCGDNSLCSDGVCGCVNNYKNCDGIWSNGCEIDISTDPDNCGECNKSCYSLSQVRSASCSNGGCVIDNCNSGYGDCDQIVDNGCETNLLTDSAHCGDCKTDCTKLDNVNTVSCNNGGCVIWNCKIGYDDCDKDVSNGCEANLYTDPGHCGSCAIDCGKNSICQSGHCACSTGFADCNDSWADGCEVNLTNDSNNCGSCGKKCNQNAYCENSNCVCNSPYANCDNDWSNGCEANLDTDLNNCGYCNSICAPANVNQAICSTGNCTYNYCNEYFIDLNGVRRDGCEYWTNFPKRYDNNLYSNLPSVILDADGNNLLIAGSVGNNLWLFKVDRYGEILWQKVISFNGVTNIRKGMRIIGDTGSLIGYLLVGEISISSRRDILIIYLNTDGDIKFAKNYFEVDSNPTPKDNKYTVYDIEYIRLPVDEKSFLVVGDYYEGSGSDPHPFYLSIYPDSGIVLNSFTYKNNATGVQIIGQFTGVKIKPNISDQVFIAGLYTDPISSISNRMLVGKVDNSGNSGIDTFRYYAGIQVENMLIVPSINGYDFYLIGTNTNNAGVLILLDYNGYSIQKGPVEIKAIDNGGSQLNLFFSSAINIPATVDRLFVSGGIVDNGLITNAIITKIKSDLSIDKMKTISLNGGISVTGDINIDLTNISDSLFLVAPYKFTSTDILAAKLLTSDLSVPYANCNTGFIGDQGWKGSSLSIGTSFSLSIQQVPLTIGSSDWKPTTVQMNGTANNVCREP